MLETFRKCPSRGSFCLSPDFRNVLALFNSYLPTTDGIFLIHQEGKQPIHLYVDACESGCGAITTNYAYHAIFPTSVRSQIHLIYHLEVLNGAGSGPLLLTSASSSIL